jgi:hypothetical protein
MQMDITGFSSCVQVFTELVPCLRKAEVLEQYNTANSRPHK